MEIMCAIHWASAPPAGCAVYELGIEALALALVSTAHAVVASGLTGLAEFPVLDVGWLPLGFEGLCDGFGDHD
ncbi:hypothetical protein [uncultured Corynebacterium sp.]|uniref:hypothetical protein n=1 Tax=uncultured Corynebacterium sp. TaxID=159447 RepID=UPI0025ECF368|nr:hypothetical protein [uncultured Corynebacterium sp.]